MHTAPAVMPAITPDALSSAIGTAPAWALLGLTVPSERLREDALREVAEHICQTLTARQQQLALPLG